MIGDVFTSKPIMLCVVGQCNFIVIPIVIAQLQNTPRAFVQAQCFVSRSLWDDVRQVDERYDAVTLQLYDNKAGVDGGQSHIVNHCKLQFGHI